MEWIFYNIISTWTNIKVFVIRSERNKGYYSIVYNNVSGKTFLGGTNKNFKTLPCKVFEFQHFKYDQVIAISVQIHDYK